MEPMTSDSKTVKSKPERLATALLDCMDTMKGRHNNTALIQKYYT